jgi:hypothetical protein
MATRIPPAAWLSSYAFATKEGGYGVLLTNATGAPTVKGTVVCASATVDEGFSLIVKDIPDPFGVVYEDGIADGTQCLVIVAGIAEVYFVGNVARKDLARGFLTADGASYVPGQALAEAVPTSPFASDKHFYEIGHAIQSRTGAGLAKCILHFN